MNGCSNFRISSSAHTVAAAVSRLAAPSGPVMTGLINSRYQSQKTFQMKR